MTLNRAEDGDDQEKQDYGVDPDPGLRRSLPLGL
jgi:hypothetical protein